MNFSEILSVKLWGLNMTFQNAVKDFVENSFRFTDYWQMQLSWSIYVDDLSRKKQITERQRNNWGNPCTPDTFKKWSNKYYGLRGEV